MLPELVLENAALGDDPVEDASVASVASRAWSPNEFLRAAAAAQHPFDAPVPLDDRIRDAISFWTDDPGKALRDVRASLAAWRRRRAELEADEVTLHSQLPPCLQQVLEGKRLLLMNEMLNIMGHPDENVVVELASGFCVAGSLPPSGVFPRLSGEGVVGESVA